MEEIKINKKNKIVILLIVIIIVLLVLVMLFATGIIKFKSGNHIDNTSNNNINLNDKINIDLSIDNVEVEKDAINSSMAVTGTLNLSYDINKYAGITLSGYCLGLSNEKYLIHGPGDGHVFFHSGETKLYLSENIPQDVVYPDGTSKSLKEIDWNNVKIKYCKIDKMIAVLNGSGNNSVTSLNFEKEFNNNTNATTNNSNTSSSQTEETKQPENIKDAATIFYENMVKNRDVVVDYDHGINIVMDKNGNVYYSADNIEKSVGTKGQYAIDRYMAGIDENGKMSNVLNGYKLDVSNVVAIYYCASGNGGWMDYILIKADGTIAKLIYSTYTKNNSTVVNIEKFEETVSGYTNIISVETSNSWDAHGYKLIDINGNIYE